MGARKFGVINIGQIGCAPLQRLQSPTGACADAVNALAAGFDDALRSLLASGLPHGLPGLAYSLGDLYGLMQATIADPRAAAGCPTWTPRAAAAACWAPRAAASPTRRCAPTAGATSSGTTATPPSAVPSSSRPPSTTARSASPCRST